MIKQPSWAKHTYPSLIGWRTDKELIKSQRFTQEQVDEWNDANRSTSKALNEDVIIDETPEVVAEPEVLTEAPIVNTPLADMTANEKTNVLTDKKPKSKPKGVKKWLNKLKKT